MSIFAAVALAQVQPRQDPVQTAVLAYQTAHSEGKSAEAAAKREIARSLLDQTPADSLQFAYSVQSVAQLYVNGGQSVQALAIGLQSLARTTSAQARIQLLETISGFYQQDRNLLQAVAYQEKAVAAMDEAAVKPSVPENKTVGGGIAGEFSMIHGGMISISRLSSPSNSRVGAYQQLARLYEQLGRPDAVAAMNKRAILLQKDDPGGLASFYEQQGHLDEAAAVLKKYAEQLDGPARAGALQQLANLYRQQQRYGDAADALQQSIISSSASAQSDGQTIWIRINLADTLQLAGRTGDADQIYGQLLSETGNGTDGTQVSVLTSFANYLSQTKREGRVQTVLTDYLTSHPNLQPQEQASLLMQLSYSARRSGDAKRANEYQRQGSEMQRTAQPPPPEQLSIGKELQAAQSAAHAGKADEAFELSLRTMEEAPQAQDRDQVTWQINGIATALLKDHADKAEQLYQRLFELVESWAADSSQPLMNALQTYPHFLLQQPTRWNEVPAAIKRYQDTVVASHGPVSGSLENVYQATMQFERMHGSPQHVIAAAQDILHLQEALSGNTSEPYLFAAEQLAREYETAGDVGRAIPVFRQAVAISDLVYRPDNVRRAQVRIAAAMALANQKHFDEAEKLASEAVAIAQTSTPPQAGPFISQLDYIRAAKNRASENNPFFTRSNQ